MNKPILGSQILDLLSEHERAIGQLYQAYAGKYGAQRTFWLVLAREEEGHARILTSFRGRMETGEAAFNSAAFDVDVLRRSIVAVDALVEGCSHTESPVAVALGQALAIEKSLLENRFFEVAGSSTPEWNRLAQAMGASIAHHVDKLSRAHAEELNRAHGQEQSRMHAREHKAGGGKVSP